VLAFYVLVFALSWGPWGLGLITGSPYALPGAELTSPADAPPFVYLTMLAGPLFIALAGILVIALAFGRVGLRDLRSRLFRWRVGVRWYAVALLTYPLLMTAILSPFWLTSKVFLPGIITAEDKASLLVAGLVAGLFASVFEELGWTGFATHEVSKRHGLLATGLIVGLPWCVVHLPLYLGNASGAVPPVLDLPVTVFAVLLPYRVLMMWVYDHTQSVLMAMLMHLPLVVCAFVLISPAMVGVPDLIFNLAFGATLWGVVAAVATADRRSSPEGNTRVQLHSQPLSEYVMNGEVSRSTRFW
jgi:membrane protease YdiL (CAAX protease family)